MSNKVDGIKKLSKKELEMSRKIVLESINESFKKGQEVLNGKDKQQPLKKVDGIFSSFISKKEEKNITLKEKNDFKNGMKNILNFKSKDSDNKNIQKSLPTPTKIIEDIKKSKPKMKISETEKKAVNEILFDNNSEQEKMRQMRLMKEKKMEEERVKAEIEAKRKAIEQEKMRQMQFLKEKKMEEERVKAEIEAKKRAQEEEKRKKEIAERKKEEEKIMAEKREAEKKALEKMRIQKEKEKQEEIERNRKRKEQLRKEKEAFRKIQEENRKKEKEIAKKEKEKKRIKRIKKIKALIRKYEKKIKNINIYLRSRTFQLTRKVLYFLIVFIVIVFILYFLFISSILKFDIDNSFSRFIADFIPVPAFATTDGIIEYYKYKDIRDSIGIEEGEDINKKIQSLAVKEIAIINLLKKYGISFDDFENREKILEFLQEKAIYDNTINQVGINRIKKIKEMINDNNDFIRIATKFGDKTGKITINSNTDMNNLKTDLFYLKNLKINEVSDIIFSEDGYYIFRCYYSSEEETSLNYVFVKAQTLNDYLSEYIKNYKLISFVD